MNIAEPQDWHPALAAMAAEMSSQSTGTPRTRPDAEAYREPSRRPIDPLEAHNGQARFAFLLAREHQDRLMHVHGMGWFYWDGSRWAEDTRGHAIRAVLEVLRDQWMAGFSDTSIAKDVKATNSAAGVRGVLEIASALEPFAATVADLDADPHLLNVANGTLDLRTMELLPHNPTNRITKTCRGAYDPDAHSPQWEQFLKQVLPDPGTRGFFQRFIGMSLVGQVVEQVFTIAHGDGANGKGVAYNSILHALGDYGHAAETDLFMTSKSNANAASPAVVKLRGKRLVVTSETERDRKLASALMKNLTGGDPITARALHRDPITFEPSHTALMVTNYLPKVAGDDPAVWRRMRVVPFTVVIPKDDQIGNLQERMKLHADAILSWAVNGYQQWRNHGLDEPESVKSATEAYRSKSDAVGRFLKARCFPNKNTRSDSADLWDAWLKWSDDDGAEPIARNSFGEELAKRGYTLKPSNGRQWWHGIGIYATEGENE